MRPEPDDDRRWEAREDRRTAPSLMPKAVQRAIAAHAERREAMWLHWEGRIFRCSVDELLRAVKIS